jgi:hypothetical protein
VFAEDELAAVARFLEGRCFPCWYSENVVTVEELEGRAVIRQANADSRQQLRQQAIAIAGGRKGMWLKEVNCHHCQNEATMVVVGNGDKLAQVKVLCAGCKTYWLS